MANYFSEAGRFHFSHVGYIFLFITALSSYHFVKEICDQSKSIEHIITWLKARSWKCEIWIRSYP